MMNLEKPPFITILPRRGMIDLHSNGPTITLASGYASDWSKWELHLNFALFGLGVDWASDEINAYLGPFSLWLQR